MRAGALAALLAWPAAAGACPVCFATDERVAWFYRLSTLGLSLLPFAVVALGAGIAIRLARDVEDARTDRVRTDQGLGSPTRISSPTTSTGSGS
jgi:hypothetical protein